MDAIRTRITEGRGRLFASVLETIGETPAIRVNTLAPLGVEIYVKAEFFNLAGSVKDRLALSIIEEAERHSRHDRGRFRQPSAQHVGLDGQGPFAPAPPELLLQDQRTVVEACFAANQRVLAWNAEVCAPFAHGLSR